MLARQAWTTAAVYGIALAVTALPATGTEGRAAPAPRATWGPVVTLAGPYEDGGYPVVAVSPAGVATALWVSDTDAVMSARRPAGGPWGTPVRIGTGLGPEVGVDARGNVTAVWTGTGAGSRVFTARRPVGEPWSAPQALSAAFPALEEDCNAGVGTDLAVAAGGATAVSWEWGSYDCDVPYRIHAIYRPAGETWKQPVRLHTGPAAAGYPRHRLGTSGRGDVFLAYGDADDSGYTVQVRRKPAGQSWTGPVEIGRGERPQIAVGAGGDAALTWHSPGLGVKVAVRPVGASWGRPRTLLDDSGFELHRVGVDAAGTATVVAVEQQGRSDAVVAWRHPIGGPWSPPVRVAPLGNAVDDLTLAVNPAGDVVAAWHRGALRASYRPGGGSWSSPMMVADRMLWGLDVGLDRDGDGAFVWFDDRVKARWMSSS